MRTRGVPWLAQSCSASIDPPDSTHDARPGPRIIASVEAHGSHRAPLVPVLDYGRSTSRPCSSDRSASNDRCTTEAFVRGARQVTVGVLKGGTLATIRLIQ